MQLFTVMLMTVLWPENHMTERSLQRDTFHWKCPLGSSSKSLWTSPPAWSSYYPSLLVNHSRPERHNPKAPTAGSHSIKDSPSCSSQQDLFNSDNVAQIQDIYITTVWIHPVWRQPVSSTRKKMSSIRFIQLIKC